MPRKSKDDREKDPNRVVRRLTWRIGISVFLFLVLLSGAFTGLFHPHVLGG